MKYLYKWNYYGDGDNQGEWVFQQIMYQNEKGGTGKKKENDQDVPNWYWRRM